MNQEPNKKLMRLVRELAKAIGSTGRSKPEIVLTIKRGAPTVWAMNHGVLVGSASGTSHRDAAKRLAEKLRLRISEELAEREWERWAIQRRAEVAAERAAKDRVETARRAAQRRAANEASERRLRAAHR